MQAKLLPEANLLPLLKRLMAEAEVIGPKRTEAGDVVFEPLERPEEALHHDQYVQSLFPLKDYFFPQTEPLFKVRLEKGAAPEPIYQERKRIFFGIRSCDVSGIRFADRFFLRDFEDIYYRKKRDNSLLISISCLEPGPNCFCVCCDGGPTLKQGYDVQLTPLGEGYHVEALRSRLEVRQNPTVPGRACTTSQVTPLGEDCYVEAGSPKGEEFLNAHQEFFLPASQEDEGRKQDGLAGVDQKFERSTYVAYAIRKITRREVADEWWEELAQRCFGIAGCRYVCPTCTCFHVVDLRDGKECVRQRSWDSCSFVGFTRMVSGETAREKPRDLLRRWGEHKLNFLYLLRDGRHGCVGCGRCLTTCLGRGDTWNIVSRIRELSQQE